MRVDFHPTSVYSATTGMNVALLIKQMTIMGVRNNSLTTMSAATRPTPPCHRKGIFFLEKLEPEI